MIVHADQREKLSFLNDNLIVKEKNGKIKLQYTCHRIFIVYIVGGFTITTGLIERGRKFGISFVFLTANYKFYESIPYKSRGNTELVRQQYQTTNSFQIAEGIVKNKLYNQRRLVAQLRLSNEVIHAFDQLLVHFSEPVKDLSTLMGLEGIGAKMYFKEMFEPLGWQGRHPRVKCDILNVLLDIGYTVLFNYIEALVSMYGFDVYKGNLHQEFYGRKSLICDLVEPFRVIIDRKVKKMYQLKQVSSENFIYTKGRYMVSYQSNHHYAADFAREINEYSSCIFEYIQSYYRWVMKNDSIENFPQGRVNKNNLD